MHLITLPELGVIFLSTTIDVDFSVPEQFHVFYLLVCLYADVPSFGAWDPQSSKKIRVRSFFWRRLIAFLFPSSHD